jgi:hypothetical protein
MPGLELQVTLGQTGGDDAPLAVAVPAGGAAMPAPAVNGTEEATPAPAPAVAPTSGEATVPGVGNAEAPQSGEGAVVTGFEPTEDQMASFIQVTGAVRSVARGELPSCFVPQPPCRALLAQ